MNTNINSRKVFAFPIKVLDFKLLNYENIFSIISVLQEKVVRIKMSRDDWIYLAVLVICIPFGYLIKLNQNYMKKKILTCATGVFITYALCGHKDLAHSLVTIVGNFLIVKCASLNSCRWLSFIYTFVYLLFFRLCHHFGFPEPAKHANAVQLLVTLRMVSLSFEIYESKSKKEDESTDKERFDSISLFDYFSYGYCYMGLLTGPFYTFKTYEDMLKRDATKISTVIPALMNLKYLPFIAVPYVFLAKYFPTSFLDSDEYLNHPYGIVYQLVVLSPTFTHFRWRFYIGWLLAESMCIMAGLGAYPVQCEARPGAGPTKPLPSEEDKSTEYNFETVHNINIYNVEAAPTMQRAMKDWNMTIQWWMATYVYKKLPISSKQVRMFLLLFVSAFWHGVHPGYYATFLSVSMVVIAESRMIRAVKPYLSETQSYILDWITWFCLYRSFEYLGIAFMMLELETIWKIWTKMFFIGHLFIFLFILLPIVIPRKKIHKEGENSEIKKD